MSDTPICDFVKEYIEKSPLRLHMPGHKGKPFLGFEAYDLTEIPGADALFEARGIIAESEKNASERFGCPTFYSTEGSSLCLRAMLYLAVTSGRGKTVLAARNIHKSFLYAAALLDIDVVTIDGEHSLLSARCTPEQVAESIDALPEKPACVFLTCPDYEGGICDIPGIAEVCHARGVLLLVDCAHGAYLRFLEPSQFPTDLGADLVCSSAHKTLPVLTGGAYLHIGNAVKDEFVPRTREALALFASTSPSYLILQSLDAVNLYLKDHRARLSAFLPLLVETKERLSEKMPGLAFAGEEPMKLTLLPSGYGYSGCALAEELMKSGVYPEFYDRRCVVLMPTPETGATGLRRLDEALLRLPKRKATEDCAPPLPRPTRAVSVREALFAPSERLPVEDCLGRILSEPGVSCPPAVPIVMCGEIIDKQAIEAMKYYGIVECSVVL